MDWMTSIPWSYMGPGTVLFIAILAIIRGDLVVRKNHEEALAQRDDVIRRERDIADRSMAALRLLAEEHGTTTDKILSALPVSEDGRRKKDELPPSLD